MPVPYFVKFPQKCLVIVKGIRWLCPPKSLDVIVPRVETLMLISFFQYYSWNRCDCHNDKDVPMHRKHNGAAPDSAPPPFTAVCL